MDHIGLREFIEQVKKELHQSVPDEPVFAIQQVELEITVGVSKVGSGKLDLQVVGLGGEYSKEHTHKITISLHSLIPTDILNNSLSETDRENARNVLLRGDK